MCSQSKQRPSQPYRGDAAVGAYYVAPTVGGDQAEYDAWETAYFNYKRDEANSIQEQQFAMQGEFYAQQGAMAEQQLAMQKSLAEQQMAAQNDIANLQAEMQKQQMEAARKLEEQRLKFEKDMNVSRQDSQRELEASQSAADKQAAFEAGRDDKKRKNQGSALASKGTKSLQVGLGTPSEASSGLAIPT